MNHTLHLRVSKRLIVSLTSAILIIAGAAYLLLPNVVNATVHDSGLKQNQNILAAESQAVKATPAMPLGTPTHLSLPRLNIQLDTKVGHYNPTSGQWTLNQTHAFYMDQSVSPVIYGHNTKAVFAPLAGIAADETLVLKLQNGQKLLFAYTKDRTISPGSNTELRMDLPNTLQLITCAGQFSEQRRIVEFRYIGLQ